MGISIKESEFQTAALHFLEELFKDLQKNKIVILDNWEIDHLCYRVENHEMYEQMKKSFLSFGQLLIESDVNGRPIATYKLHTAIQFRGWNIDVVELPAPKPSKPTPTGFEHIEVVCDMSFAELQNKYQHLNLDLGGLKKDINPELEIILGARNIKFHHISLEEVIRFEKALLKN